MKSKNVNNTIKEMVPKMRMRLGITLVLSLILPFGSLTGCSGKEEFKVGQQIEVQRGDITIAVTSDGNLIMPHEVDLRFGTTGAVQQVLVKEGEEVKEGTLLATLDSSTQKNAIKNALYDIQLARDDFDVQASSDCARKQYYPYDYPNASALRIFNEISKDLEASQDYWERGYYKEAMIELSMVQCDIEVCIELLGEMNNAEVYAAFYLTPAREEQMNPPDYMDYSQGADKAISSLQQDLENIWATQRLIKDGAYNDVDIMLNKAREHLIISQVAVKSVVDQTTRFTLSYPDTATSLDYLQSAGRSITELLNRVNTGDFDSIEFSKIIRLSKLDLQISRDNLENHEIIFEGTFNPLELQQYNLDLQNAELSLQEVKKEFLKTQIIAPFDGTVVEVGVKIEDVLSAQDYSSRTAIKLVDTNTIKFEGIIDEIDIFKVRVGQRGELTVDAEPDKQFTGTVTFISPFASEDTNVVSFPVTLEFDPVETKLWGGLTATADILIDERKDVLMIPLQAIMSTPEGNMAMVFNEATGAPAPRPITLGIRDKRFVEILSGLNEGETVIIIELQLPSPSMSGSAPPSPGGSGSPPRQFLR